MTDTPTKLDENETNWLIQFPDGSTDVITKNSRNRLLYEHNLWAVVSAKKESLVIQGGENAVRLHPDEEGFTLQIGDTDPVHVGNHLEPDLMDALFEVYDGEERNPAPLINFFRDIRADQVRRRVFRHLADEQPFADHVSHEITGWLIHGHLLLTWEGEFYHPKTATKEVQGDGVRSTGQSQEAYNVNVGQCPDAASTLTIEDEQVILTESEMEFLAKALWGIAKAPTPPGSTPDEAGAVEVEP